MLTICLVICPEGHITCYKIKNKASLLKMAKEKKIICPRCGKNIEELKTPKWSPEQYFFCDKGHVTSIYPFNGDRFNISWSDKEFMNIENDAEKLKQAIISGEIRCPVTNHKSEICNMKMAALSEDPLMPTKLATAKTKVRVGDLWDKYKCPEPKQGTYDQNYDFHDSEFARRQRLRVKELKKTRLTKKAGEVIDKATNRSYREKRHKKPPKSELK